MRTLRAYGTAALVVALLLIPNLAPARGHAQTGNCQTFTETGKTVCGLFLSYWREHGGLAQQGYPISTEMQERSDLNGQTYTVQYFERSVFEKHPENPPPHDVLLSQLGTFQYREKYPGAAGAPNQRASTTSPRQFAETGKTIGGAFRAYWEANGGLAQQGYPISNEFRERSDLNGLVYTVQYFERAVFESHPENAPPHRVLLSQLGTFQYRKKYQGAPTQGPGMPPTNAPTNVPASTPTSTSVPPTATPTRTATPSGPAVVGQAVVLREGVTITLDHAEAIVDATCGKFMEWGYTLTNNSSTPYEVALNRESVLHQDDLGNEHESVASSCFQNGGFGGAFTTPTTLAANANRTAYIRIFTGQVGPAPSYFLISMELSGTTLQFRNPVPGDLR